MADLKNKINSWLNKEQSDVNADVKESASTAEQDNQMKEKLPESDKQVEGEMKQETSNSVPEDKNRAFPVQPVSKEKGDWETRQTDLLHQQEEAQKKLAQLSQELTSTRKSLREDLRKKEEERIKLLAQITLSDRQAQVLDHQREAEFSKVQLEAQKEIEALENRITDESNLWAKELQNLQEKQQTFSTELEFQVQQKELVEKKKVQELERNIVVLHEHISNLMTQMQAEQKQWTDQIKNLENEIVDLTSQLQLKESNRRSQEQRESEVQ